MTYIRKLIFFLTLVTWAFTPDTMLNAQSTNAPSSYPLYANAPAAVDINSINIDVVGGLGNATYYYWVLANYPSGQVISSPKIARNLPVILNMSNYAKITWKGVTGATSYVVLRTPTANFPVTGICTTCRVANNVTATTYNETVNPTVSYTITSASPALAQIRLNNLTYSRPRIGIDSLNVGLDLSPITFTKPVKTGATNPSFCETGEFFFNTAAMAGTNIRICVNNVWYALAANAAPGGMDHDVQCNIGGVLDACATGVMLDSWLNQAPVGNSGTNYQAIGDGALEGNQGNFATAYGIRAGQSNTDHNVTFVGYESGVSNTGNSVTAVGKFAASGNSGELSNFYGSNSGQNNTGDQVTAMGDQSGYANSGNAVTAIGASAGGTNTGDNLTAVGYTAGYGSAGNENTFIGMIAGMGNVGQRNSVLGYCADCGKTGGEDNVILGFGTKAGGVAGTHRFTGTQTAIQNSVVIGSTATTTINNSGGALLTNIIAIGGEATASNTTVIGNPSTLYTTIEGSPKFPAMANTGALPVCIDSDGSLYAGTNTLGVLACP